MNDSTQQIELFTLISYLGLFAIPAIIFYRLKIKVNGQLFVAVVRMTAQLFMVGFYLKYLFAFNSPAINIFYILLMLLVANISILKQSGLSFRQLGLPVFVANLFTVLFIGLSFSFVLNSSVLLNSRYIIPLIGMLMGNILRYNIVTLSRFYGELKKRENEYIQNISLGATVSEATLPFLREALQAGVAPQIGGLATMGLVSLPGMMTGQILGGSMPMTAIKYQILILTAIFVAGSLSALLVITLSRRVAFDRFKRIRFCIYR